MGACISSSSYAHQFSNPKQSMDYAGPKSASFVIASPIGDKPTSIVTRPMPEDLAANYRLSSSKFRSFANFDDCAASKEDVFFESQPWLESDGDDDFFSVNGDLTPSITSSSSNTPSHKSLLAAHSSHLEVISADHKLTLSPVKRRKSLSELFRESEEEEEQENFTSSSEKETDDDTMEVNVNSTAQVPKSVTSKPHFPEHNFTNSSGNVKVKKDMSQKSAHHCLPRLFSVASKKNATVAAQ